MKTRAFLFLTALFLAVVSPVLSASACSCVQPNAAEFLQTGDFVFVGSLLDREDAPMGQMEDITYTFSIEAVYVGDIRDATIGIRSAPNGAACGFEVVPGEPVGIVANLSDGALRSGLCQTVGAAELEAAAQEAGIEPRVPEEPSGPATTVAAAQEETGTGSDIVIWGGAAAALAAAGLGAALWRRRSPS